MRDRRRLIKRLTHSVTLRFHTRRSSTRRARARHTLNKFAKSRNQSCHDPFATWVIPGSPEGLRMGQSFESLPPEERTAHYREMARQVMQLASVARSPVLRAQFVQLVESWLALASEVERQSAEHVPPTPRSEKIALSRKLN